MQRVNLTSAPHIIFTRDFHELVRGNLAPNSRCSVSYDQQRIVPPDEPYLFGDPSQPIVAHVRFRTDGPIEDFTLRSPMGIREHAPTTETGRGAMLSCDFEVPSDAAWIEIWFSFHASSGRVYHDSNHGKNFRLRFAHEDLHLLEAEVAHEEGSPFGAFNCRVAAASEVRALTLRYRITNVPGNSERKEVALERADEQPSPDQFLWVLRKVPVPFNAVVSFDLVYWIGNERYKDDNQGNYFIAAHPEKMTRMQR